MNINSKEFILPSIPQLHPLSSSYTSFWREQKRRCIEGYWVGGYYMPPALYFYINFATIRLNKKPYSPKSWGRPHLRDIDWDFFRHYTEARGFSGFLLDDVYSSNRILLDSSVTDEFLLKFYPNTISSTGSRKLYIPAREALAKQYPASLGAPLFENPFQNFMMMGGRNFGKDIHADELLHYADGTARPIKDVQIGDQIYDHLSKLVTVKNIFHFDDQQQVTLYLDDGRKIKCGLGHKWYVRERKGHSKVEDVVKTTQDILTNFRKGVRKDVNYWIPLAKAVPYSEKQLPLDPYLLGVLLGDGGLTQRVGLTTADPEMLSYLKTPDKIAPSKGKYQYYLNGGHTLEALKQLGLHPIKSSDKFIPPEYFISSIEQRKDLLKGLLDTDGHITRAGNIEYSSKSKQLADGVVRICRSLGIYTTEGREKNNHYRVYIRSAEPLFKLKRKYERCKVYRFPVRHTHVAIKHIEYGEVEPSVCIEVDSKESLFLAGDFIPTHNSYSVGAGIIPHTFLFDGATSYSLDQPSPVELIVGAHSSDKSADLLKKSKDSMEMLPGKLTISSRTYPSPFSKRIQGSWDVNREIVATYKKRTQGGWENAGSKSSIKHRSFNSNPFAAQGTRPMLLVLEEIGMFANLKEVYLHTVDALRNGLTKTGMLLMLGTGGDMDRGTIDAAEMFYSPEKYDILPFKDEWENGKDIGYFVPAYLSLPEFKDDNGVTDIPAAKQALLNNRDKLRKGKGGSEALNQEIQYKPLVPSEMFLARRAHIFPSAEIQRRLSEVISQDLYYKAEKKVDLFFDPISPYNGVSYKIDHSLTPITSFPHTDPNVEGAVVIYELPHLQDGAVPPGAYIIGCDPFKEDDPTSSSFSLASIYVMKTSKYYSTIGHDEIVASYLGRPYMGKNAVNEVLYKLSLFYGNAKIYFENSVGNVKDYFEKIRRLDLLAAQPVTIFNKKASHRTAPSVIYGYPISNDKVKWEAIQYLRSWLLEVRDEETNTRNLDHILDPGLLQELLSFRMGSSEFDRVMSLVACSIGLEELHNLNKRSLEHEVQTLPLQKEFNDFIVNNKRLFNPINNVSTPTPTF